MYSDENIAIVQDSLEEYIVEKHNIRIDGRAQDPNSIRYILFETYNEYFASARYQDTAQSANVETHVSIINWRSIVKMARLVVGMILSNERYLNLVDNVAAHSIRPTPTYTMKRDKSRDLSKVYYNGGRLQSVWT